MRMFVAIILQMKVLRRNTDTGFWVENDCNNESPVSQFLRLLNLSTQLKALSFSLMQVIPERFTNIKNDNQNGETHFSLNPKTQNNTRHKDLVLNQRKQLK